MTITLPTTACRRARAARLAHRRTAEPELVAARVPAPRESAENLGPAAPAPIAPAPAPSASLRTDPHRRRIPRNSFRDDERAAQALVFATESADLRERATRHGAVLGAGGGVDRGQVDAVLRAFRSYEPFLSDHDRALNAVARRRLIAAARAVDLRR